MDKETYKDLIVEITVLAIQEVTDIYQDEVTVQRLRHVIRTSVGLVLDPPKSHLYIQ